MYTNATYKSTNMAGKYIKHEIENASQPELVLKIFDFAITSCKKGDMEKTNNAIGVLISALRFDREDLKKISVDLLRLYQFVQDKMREGDTDISLTILQTLKNTFKEVFDKNK